MKNFYYYLLDLWSLGGGTGRHKLVVTDIYTYGKPYVYKIENKIGEFYFGVRWDYSGNPENDLWINYFTSSLRRKWLCGEIR